MFFTFAIDTSLLTPDRGFLSLASFPRLLLLFARREARRSSDNKSITRAELRCVPNSTAQDILYHSSQHGGFAPTQGLSVDEPITPFGQLGLDLRRTGRCSILLGRSADQRRRTGRGRRNTYTSSSLICLITSATTSCAFP